MSFAVMFGARLAGQLRTPFGVSRLSAKQKSAAGGVNGAKPFERRQVPQVASAVAGRRR